MFFVFEMANNHMGSVSHAKKIIDEFSNLSIMQDLNAGIKLQFRNLDTFIHKDFKNSELKYVKRFNETKLPINEIAEIIDYIHQKDLTSVATQIALARIRKAIMKKLTRTITRR